MQLAATCRFREFGEASFINVRAQPDGVDRRGYTIDPQVVQIFQRGGKAVVGVGHPDRNLHFVRRQNCFRDLW